MSPDDVLDLFERWGQDPYDEEVAQLDHALQTAALAVAGGADDALVAAALLHDVGHLLVLRGDPLGPHERTGPAALTGAVPPEVLRPIELHVQAKRYLCATDPTYAAGLSAGSTASLVRQGGPMTTADVREFEAEAGWDDAVRLRRWDDAGKVEGLVVAPLREYEPLLRSLWSSAS